MNITRILILTFLLSIIRCLSLEAQEAEQLAPWPKQRKNIIKWDVTNRALFGKGNIVLSYERVIKPNQTASISVGIRRFPNLVGIQTDYFSVVGQDEQGGLSIALDYRFYPKKQNKFQAPTGIFVGPYLSYLNYKTSSQLQITEQGVIQDEFDLNGRFQVQNIGFQLGYQFLFFKRLSVDMVLFGPSISNYDAKLSIEGDFTQEQINKYYEDYRDIIQDQYPLLEDLVQDQEVSSSGRFNVWSFGFRYNVSIGFFF